MKYQYPLLNAEMPGREDVKKMTPNPASKELFQRMEDMGIETYLDRYEAQQPQCNFGLRGLCCKMCQWGPCRISPKSPKGICGKDLNSMVLGNIIRALVSGMAGHGRHAHEVYMSIMAAADGEIDFPIVGKERVYDLAEKFEIEQEGKTVEQLAKEVTQILIDDLGRMNYEPIKMLEAFAPQERKDLWESLGVIPRSASYEIMETLHMTTLGGNSDWTNLAAQELRSALAYCYSTLFGSSMATEILFGIPRPKLTNVNYGILKEDSVNILLHGHSPVMAEKILQKTETSEMKELAKKAGAKGIVVGGMCCTGDELLARYGVPTVTNILGQELAMGTGAVDCVVADMQCVIPGMQTVADCFGTKIVTTCNSNRIPGATHIPFDPEQNTETLEEDAVLVVKMAIEAYEKRDRSKIKIPQETSRAMGGFSYEAILESFGGREKLLELLKSGKIKGIATVVGCNNPKVPYENNHVTIAKKLIESGILVTTTGCCSHALLNAGLCDPDAADLASENLKEVCREHEVPPVLHVGGCVDNARSLRLFMALAEEAGVHIKDMPYIFVGPEPGNEKTVGQGLSFLTHGVSNCIGYPAPIPVPLPKQVEGEIDEFERGSNDIADFFAGDEGVFKKVGAKVYTEPYPKLAAQTIKMHIHRKRKGLGW